MRAMWLTGLTRALAVTLMMALIGTSGPIQAQDKQHVVSLSELSKDSSVPAETRQANEAAVRQLFTSEPGQKALKSANIDYAKVDQAVGQLNDEDVAKLAGRSRQVEKDFAAGRLSDRDLLIIVIIAVLLIALIAVLH
jgi:uncharacterized protein (UPF0147 family)